MIDSFINELIFDEALFILGGQPWLKFFIVARIRFIIKQ